MEGREGRGVQAVLFRLISGTDLDFSVRSDDDGRRLQ